MDLIRLIELKCDEAADEIVHMRIKDLNRDNIRNLLSNKIISIFGNVQNKPFNKKAAANENDLIRLIKNNPGLSRNELSQKIGEDSERVARMISKLIASNKIRKEGRTRATKYFSVR